MNKLKSFLSASKINVAAFVVASALALTVSIGAASAAVTYLVDTYVTGIAMYDIGVTLMENGEDVSWRNYAGNGWEEGTGVLLGNMIGEDESLELGKTYDEVLCVRNSGTINQYIRVTIYKYWLDADGEKLQELSPDLIDLHLLCDYTGAANGWILDTSSSTTERTVLYYSDLLYSEYDGGGASVTAPFSDTLTIDGSIADKVSAAISTDEYGYTNIKYTYDYDGVQFRIKVVVDAVQEHNAEDALGSVIGEDGSLSLE